MGEVVRRSEVLVSTEWLAGHLDDPTVRIVDCRYYFDRDGCEAYVQSHIPGAIHLNWAADLSDPNSPVPFMIAPPDQVARVLGAKGIGNDSLIVAYDDEGGHYASRLWLILARYGQADRLRILDGGWTKWVREGRPVTAELAEPAPATFHLGDGAARPEIIAGSREIGSNPGLNFTGREIA